MLKFYVVYCLLLFETFSFRIEEIDFCYKNKNHISLHNWQSFSLRIISTLRNKRKLAAVSRETPENTRNNQSQNTLNPGMAEEYITQVSEEIEGRVIKKLSQEFSRMVSRILGALSKLHEFLLNPQVPQPSREHPGTSTQKTRNPLGIVS